MGNKNLRNANFMTEDEVRDLAKSILNFTNEKDAKVGVGQL